jgi:hypothetical protein
MDKGRIIERGRHEELLANKGFYHHIWTLQHNAGEDFKGLCEPPFRVDSTVQQSLH